MSHLHPLKGLFTSLHLVSEKNYILAKCTHIPSPMVMQCLEQVFILKFVKGFLFFLSFFWGGVIKLFPQTPLARCLFTISKSTDKLVEHVACL